MHVELLTRPADGKPNGQAKLDLGQCGPVVAAQVQRSLHWQYFGERYLEALVERVVAFEGGECDRAFERVQGKG